MAGLLGGADPKTQERQLFGLTALQPNRAPAAAPKPVAPVAFGGAIPSAGGAGGAGGGGAPSVGPINNTSAPNANVSSINQTLTQRAQGDMGATDRARQAGIGIRDDAENERMAARQNAANRGVSGGGIEGWQQGGITRDVLRDQTKAKVDIFNDAEARRDNLYGQIANQELASDASQRADRSLGLNQWSATVSANQAARQAERADLGAIVDLFGLNNYYGGSDPVFGYN